MIRVLMHALVFVLFAEELLTQVGPILNGSNEMGAILDMLLAQESLASPPPS